jgi:hypothetical protein
MRVSLRTGCAAATILAAFAALACGMDGPTASAMGAAVKSGQWGGQHIAMTVAAARTTIEFDCATASVAGPIDADRDGVFSVAGTFQPERPGPIGRDGPPPSRPMRLSGTVKGDEMQLNVRLTDQNEDAGTFTLTFGAAPRLMKCR